MHFLFVYPSPGILGGIETLLVRMSRWLASHGHQVTLLVKENQHWAGMLPAEVRCIALGQRFYRLEYFFHAGRVWNELGIAKPDVIKSFDLPSLWVACQLAARMRGKRKVIAGLYNPYIFKWLYPKNSATFWDDESLCLKNFLRCVPENARLFCGVDQIEELTEVHQQKGVLWPLPIDEREFDPAPRRVKPGKIVSVGRLSPMKEYNLYMVDVVKELIRRGHQVSWSVYGKGPFEAEMRAAIKTHGLENAITLEGTAPYHRLREVLADASVFVGMGTSILEAALFKVPNVVAVAYDREGVTYGPIYRLPPGSISELSTRPPRLKVVDEIERILRLGPADYRAEEDLVWRHVQVNEIETSMKRFIELVEQADSVTLQRSLYLANYPFWFLRKAIRKKMNYSGPGAAALAIKS